MHKSWRKAALAAGLTLTGALGGLVAATPAQAQPVASGSVTFGGDPGDYITGGRSYAYSVADGDQLTTAASADTSHVSVGVNGYQGDWWSVDFDAPGSTPLTPGTYQNATRYPFNGAGPGLSLDGNGRGCNELTGTFTVLNAVFGPNGYVQTFDATFEQHCEGGTPAARGEVHIANPPPPAPLDLALAVATDGTASSVSGKAVVHGTVTCNQPTSVSLNGTVTEIVKKTIVRGDFSTRVNCVPGTPAAWTATAVPIGTVPFVKGKAEVDTRAQGYDSEYDKYVEVNDTTVVKLVKS
ncbi:hypothetical protein [Micromonospora sp. WMMD998]|uniref:hypothetical protein n=1 Tax=Micromonospora sp. WMMD998 TaxID=3016092 RepID=UPI002499DA79|nr:hypothetical protein [Micromonospora sp. WMMD998]WFE37993.1 hypothetical protein O7619_05920 [Micromonospora sp. WMMD998]